jgi:hypothetical protein
VWRRKKFFATSHAWLCVRVVGTSVEDYVARSHRLLSPRARRVKGEESLKITRALEKSRAGFMNAILYARRCFRVGTIDASKGIIKALARLVCRVHLRRSVSDLFYNTYIVLITP